MDARADLYSAGVVLCECLTGALPIDAATPFALAAKVLDEVPVSPEVTNPDVPPALASLVLRLLGKQPMDRPDTAVALGDMLRQMQ